VTQLSEHFSLEEMTFSDTAIRLGIDNQPDDEQLVRLTYTASQLEGVREILGPMHINSALRVEQLERVITAEGFKAWCVRHKRQADEGAWQDYFGGKQHPKGEAADCKSLAGLTPLQMCQKVTASDIYFDQLIYEYAAWMHISFVAEPKTPRLNVITINNRGTFPGLVE